MQKAIIWVMAFLAIAAAFWIVWLGILKTYRAMMRESELDEAAELTHAKRELQAEIDRFNATEFKTKRRSRSNQG